MTDKLRIIYNSDYLKINGKRVKYGVYDIDERGISRLKSPRCIQ